MLHAHYSNRTERLAAIFSAVLRDTSSAPQPCRGEIVVVNNAGMGRWLQLEVARANGIAANIRTLFPAEMTWSLLQAVLPGVPPVNAFEPRYLAWHLFRLFDEVAGRRGFEPIARYVGEADDYRQWTLAQRLARVFDQYVVFRPDWIASWEDGKAGDWQGSLWRALVARLGEGHWARLQQDFVDALADGAADATRLPPRIHVFGIPTLSPGYLRALAAAARVIDVHLYWFNPCREYWADIVTPREAGEAEGAHFERGNSLLADWGRQGRETLDQLQELSPLDDEDYEPAGAGTLLASIQDDILDLVERGESGAAAWPADGDDSIAIHACHGPMREIEVLHDQLLARFAADPDLGPADVLVMTPDMQTYAPIIDAVFSTAPAPLRIPFAIADRSLRERLPVIEAFLSLLDLVDERATPEFVVGLLRSRPVAAAFELADADIDNIRRWLDATAIRWGFDADHRQRLGLPATDEHTWRGGLDRLVLGHAMPVETAFAGVLPWPGIEPGDARMLGRFHRFVTELERAARSLSRPRAMEDWSRELARLLDTFFRPGADDEAALATLREAIVTLAADAEAALGDRPVSLDVVRACLQEACESGGEGVGFLGGGVTFCSMVPMRSIPFKLICLVGMNDDAFPRIETRSSLDRMAREYRRGDRSRREDDRYLFLEILLSARQSLYISYVGRNIKDNAELPPSVVVSDLLDYVGRGLVGAGDESRRGALLERLVTVHSLQGFNRRYFENDPRYPGHVPYLARAAAALGNPQPAPPFVEAPLPPVEDDIALADLVFFYSNPARSLLRNRFGVWLDEKDEVLDDREPFAVDRDAGEAIRREWLDHHARAGDLDGCERVLRLSGLLPHGLPGRIHLEREADALEALRGIIEAGQASPLCEPVPIDLPLDGRRVIGSLDDVREAGLFRYHLRKVHAPDRIRLIIEHLAGCAAGVLPGPSRLLTMEGAWILEPLDAAAALDLLRPWIVRYLEGLCAPMHFFPRAAWAWYDARDRDDRLDRARRTWLGSGQNPGENVHPYYRKVFGGIDPIDDAFDANLSALLLPAAGYMDEWHP